MRIKIGNTEFDWTRTHSIIAGIVALVVVALVANSKYVDQPPGGPTDVHPPYPITVNVQLTPQQRAEAEQMSRGAMLFVFFHEAGHMMIGELGIPATGPEEDVADEFASFILGQLIATSADATMKNVAATILYDGAVYWKIAAQNQDVNKIPWADEHSPSLKRYFNILCIAVGADPQHFKALAIHDGFDERRLQMCAADFARKSKAWDELMSAHEKDWFSRTLGLGNGLILVIGDPGKPEWKVFQDVYTYGGFFKQILDGISGATDFPRDIPVIVKGCNVVNAWYAPDNHTVTLCDDFFQHLMDTFAQAEVAGQNNGGDIPPPGPMPAPGGPPQAGGQSIVGSWQCQLQTATGPAVENDTYMANGAFSVHSQWQTGTVMNSQGTWSMAGSNTIQVVINSTDSGMATPVTFSFTFQMPNPNQLMTQAGTCQRVG